MTYAFIDDAFTADIGFTASGRTADELLVAAAEATMNVMVEDLEAIAGRELRRIELSSPSLEMALFDLLQELIFHKDAEMLLLRITRLDLDLGPDRVTLSAEAWGETIAPHRHRLLVDVKAVTLHRFAVEQTPDGWKATVVLDI